MGEGGEEGEGGEAGGREGVTYFSSFHLFCCGMAGIDGSKQIWRDSVLCDAV
jgi:hypothetical protein